MLVCNVALRPPRSAIAADLAEVVAATDATATGNVVFATLVDDPASVADHVDAYSGEIMQEAASAAVTVNAGLVYSVTILEDTIAASTQSSTAPTIYTGAIIEVGTASDAISGSAVAATRTTTSTMGPLFAFDTTFAASTLTVINVGR